MEIAKFFGAPTYVLSQSPTRLGGDPVGGGGTYVG